MFLFAIQNFRNSKNVAVENIENIIEPIIKLENYYNIKRLIDVSERTNTKYPFDTFPRGKKLSFSMCDIALVGISSEMQGSSKGLYAYWRKNAELLHWLWNGKSISIVKATTQTIQFPKN